MSLQESILSELLLIHVLYSKKLPKLLHVVMK